MINFKTIAKLHVYRGIATWLILNSVNVPEPDRLWAMMMMMMARFYLTERKISGVTFTVYAIKSIKARVRVRLGLVLRVRVSIGVIW